MCLKKQYSKREAHVILNERKNKHKKWAKEIRAYECPYCIENKEDKVWHLTSMEEYEERETIELIFKEEWEKLKAM